ncbi:ParB N-terminal domain-containing protein [Paenarthrobacter aurescens]|uniref:ParB-like N-terminal domain-containing protein n=1 Tax=Paenarthrobacter aurescens TaxID=43663 RepID=A0A4Y3N8F5_PAEAU|nr:ParB N-terminal domain-containing protein [Paenarthrobacter aurescens]MDO6143367.1 ParB N-terminal domain-containing protein [Paenarthrobacter aurescens]MDO6147215.1 ParB N-terminal domain-containing protein [Paenarthrobacter aurescens]MDO6158459.1 ParB N-terminal domain-containing protein [Paenarthrobacter aurescens]MDO6162443.1 ParB N-terminal domain-containing protein [Paenarthrobacter aurescens]GEB18184.1 hypothetical protein AAU01_09390 [Paenarthrobacter aurescens]
MTAPAIYADMELPLQHLLLDPNNFRFQDEPGFVLADEGRFAEKSVQDRAYRRIRTENITELKNSILANGFLTVERLVVRKYGDGASYLVVEGNRRLAALRWIKEDHDAGVNVRSDVLEVLDRVPVVSIEAEAGNGDYLAIMGVRHVGGIKQWGGYQRAKLVTDLRDEYGFDTQEVASRLGMSPQEVNRRYRAFKALQQMRNDEEYMDLASSSMYPIFHEALAIPAVRTWLSWDDRSLRFTDEDQLHVFYSLITESTLGSDEEGSDVRGPKLPSYTQVRELRNILPNPDARQILLDPDRSFADALGVSKAEELSRTWRSQVSEAITVMNQISALELAKMKSQDLDVVRRVQQTASDVLQTYAKLAVD